MEAASQMNKKAWEYRAYEFWMMNNGTPQEIPGEFTAYAVKPENK